MSNAYCPQRGDIVWMSMSPQAGSEQRDRRPALVLSPESYNRSVGLALCCPLTSKQKGYPFEVPVGEGLPVSGVILADQLRSLDWRARECQRIGRLPDETVERVLHLLSLLLTSGGRVESEDTAED
ncbi:MAG: endoribonuclease MazF [Bacteroidota bacterium]|nr:endoribonuclease MazF [Bacteroidota bacterium]